MKFKFSGEDNNNSIIPFWDIYCTLGKGDNKMVDIFVKFLMSLLFVRRVYSCMCYR